MATTNLTLETRRMDLFAPFKNSSIHQKCMTLFLEKAVRGKLGLKFAPTSTKLFTYHAISQEIANMSEKLKGRWSEISFSTQAKAHEIALSITKKLQTSDDLDAQEILAAGLEFGCDETMLTEYKTSLQILQKAIFRKICDKRSLIPLQNSEDVIKDITTWLQTNQSLIATITELDLSDKNMALCPPEIRYLTGLQKLELCKNSTHSFSYATHVFLVPWNLLPPSLTHLDLSGSSLGEIPSNALEKLPHLTTLSLSKCQLHCLPDNLFANSSALQKLDLSCNNLLGFSMETFSGISKLIELNLATNVDYVLEVRRLGDRDLGKLFQTLPTTIEKLDFSSNLFTHPSIDTLKKFKNLQEINLSFCSMSATTQKPLPSLFLANSRLTKVNLSNNHILSLSQNTFDGPKNLQELNLSNNYLQGTNKQGRVTFDYLGDCNLDSLFQALPSTLVTLSFSNNRFKTPSPTTLKKLVNLQNLDLSQCQIDSLPNGVFQHLKNLRMLSLCGNRLLFLERDVFDGADKLEVLNISSNTRVVNHEERYSYLHLGEQNLNLLFARFPKSLQSLDFSRNDFRHADATTLQRLSNLKTLILRQCQIFSIPEGIFSSTSSLEKLDLSLNHITNIAERTFEGLTEKLQKLDLSLNHITNIAERTFEGLTEKLQKLDLSYNQLNDLATI